MMDRLNNIPGIVVHNVCAGHGLTTRANRYATLGFYTSPALGLWMIQQLGDSRLPYARLSQYPGLYYGYGRWSVHLECRMFSEHINHVRWWELITNTLERLVRRYHREQTLREGEAVDVTQAHADVDAGLVQPLLRSGGHAAKKARKTALGQSCSRRRPAELLRWPARSFGVVR